jgi:D-alanine-D-alanine ligase
VRIGIAFDLRSDFEAAPGSPEDALEEYDSEATIAAIGAALAAAGHEAVRLGGGRRLLERLLSDPPDLVFNIAEGRGSRSREAHVPAACEMLGVPVTHSDPLACALTLDKEAAKRVAASAGVPTPRFAVIESADAADGLGLRFPVIAKLCWEGSSIGIRRSSRAEDPAALRAEVARLLAGYAQPVLVEEFCPGDELTVGILGTGRGARAIGTMAIVPRRARPEEFVYSLEVKRDFANEVDYRCPPPHDAGLVARVEEVALAAYRALRCRDVGRVDVRLDAAGDPQFIEVNPLPGLGPETGDIVLLARGMGITHEGLVGLIVGEASRRLGLP